MKSKFPIVPIILFLLISSPILSQVNVNIDCPQTIVKDSTTFVFKDWIKKEIPKDSLIPLSEKAYVEVWGIPENELQNHWSDTLLINSFEKGKSSFLEEMKTLKYNLESNYRIYLYSSSISDWKTLAGEVGIVVLRGCELINIYVIARS